MATQCYIWLYVRVEMLTHNMQGTRTGEQNESPCPAATADAADADAAADAVVFGLASTIVSAAAAAAFREIVFEAAATVVVVAGTDASAVVLMPRQL